MIEKLSDVVRYRIDDGLIVIAAEDYPKVVAFCVERKLVTLDTRGLCPWPVAMKAAIEYFTCQQCHDPQCGGAAYHALRGAWGPRDPRRLFVDGAKQWEYTKTGATMWAADVAIMEAEAERRYPNGVVAADGRL